MGVEEAGLGLAGLGWQTELGWAGQDLAGRLSWAELDWTGLVG